MYKNNNVILFLQLETLGGEFITVIKDPSTRKTKIVSKTGESKLIALNIKTKIGLVHVINTVLT